MPLLIISAGSRVAGSRFIATLEMGGSLYYPGSRTPMDEKAQSEPARFRLLSIDLAVEEASNKSVVSYRAGVWTCTCQERLPCRHVVAAKSVVKVNVTPF